MREKLEQIGARLARRLRRLASNKAEVAVTQYLFAGIPTAEILTRIRMLTPIPT